MSSALDPTPVTLDDLLKPTLSEDEMNARISYEFEAKSTEAIQKAREAIDRSEALAAKAAAQTSEHKSLASVHKAERERNSALRNMAREMSPAMMLSIAMVAMDKTQGGSARVQAAALIMERGHGKSVQPVSTMQNDIIGLTATEAFDAVIKAAHAGEITLEELAIMSKVISEKSKATDLATVMEKINELEAIITAGATRQ